MAGIGFQFLEARALQIGRLALIGPRFGGTLDLVRYPPRAQRPMTTAEEHLNHALQLRDTRQYEAAIREIELAMELDYERMDYLEILADTHHAAGDLSQSIATMERLLRKQRALAAESAIKIARLESLRENRSAAVKRAREAVVLDPDDAFAHSMLAYHLLCTGDYAAACVAGAEAVRLEPDAPEHLVNFAVAHEELGRLPEAIAAYRKMLQLDPADEIAAEQLARLGVPTTADPPTSDPSG